MAALHYGGTSGSSFLGGEYEKRWGGLARLGLDYTHHQVTAAGDARLESANVRAGVEYEVERGSAFLCPAARVSFGASREWGDFDVVPMWSTSTSLHLTLGTKLLQSGAVELIPYVEPRYGWNRSLSNGGSDWLGALSTRLGTLVQLWSRVHASASVNFAEGGSRSYGLQAGIHFE